MREEERFGFLSQIEKRYKAGIAIG